MVGGGGGGGRDSNGHMYTFGEIKQTNHLVRQLLFLVCTLINIAVVVQCGTIGLLDVGGGLLQ